MIIAVDAMGGDHAPKAVVSGAVLAAKEFGTNILLVGDENRINKELLKHDSAGLSIKIKHASESVEMDEAPSIALRKKRDSSIRVGVEAVKNKEADAIVSAGNTGAVLAATTVILKPLEGIIRPAIATILPSSKGFVLLLDAGANVDCKAAQLFQFGIMGHVYAKYLFDRPNPKVGILSIGEEDNKGNEVTKETFKLLKQGLINFIGNLEGREVYKGIVDVIVCDGFTGNISLKISESLAEMIELNLKKVFSKNFRGKLAYLLIKPGLISFKKSVDYSEYGGAPLLGINGVCIIAHGKSSPKAIKNAIKLAETSVRKKVVMHIYEEIELNLQIQNNGIKRGGIWKHIKETMHFTTNDKEEIKE